MTLQERVRYERNESIAERTNRESRTGHASRQSLRKFTPHRLCPDGAIFSFVFRILVRGVVAHVRNHVSWTACYETPSLCRPKHRWLRPKSESFGVSPEESSRWILSHRMFRLSTASSSHPLPLGLRTQLFRPSVQLHPILVLHLGDDGVVVGAWLPPHHLPSEERRFQQLLTLPLIPQRVRRRSIRDPLCQPSTCGRRPYSPSTLSRAAGVGVAWIASSAGPNRRPRKARDPYQPRHRMPSVLRSAPLRAQQADRPVRQAASRRATDYRGRSRRGSPPERNQSRQSGHPNRC